MGRIVAILNQKGGVGKTTVVLGLAAAADAAGHRVLVVDLDPQGSTSWVLGVDPRLVDESVAEVMGRTPAERAIVESHWGESVSLLPSSPRLLGRDHASNVGRLGAALREVADDYDAVLIDCPPSLGLTMYDRRNRLTDQVADDVRSCLRALVFESVIPRNVRLSEAPSHGLPALIYDHACPGSQAYMKLARELIGRLPERRQAA